MENTEHFMTTQTMNAQRGGVVLERLVRVLHYAPLAVQAIIALLALCQIVWMMHVNSKFKGYAREWHAAYARNDRAAMERWLAAEHRAHDDNFVLPTTWPARWNADYTKEAP